SFADDWDDGHYVVVTAVGRQAMLFEDPSILGGRGTLTRAEFLDRWHDRDGHRDHVHTGILFRGKRPAPLPDVQHIDEAGGRMRSVGKWCAVMLVIGGSSARGALPTEPAPLLQAYMQIDTTNPPGHEMRAARFWKTFFDEQGIEAEIFDLGNDRA